MLSLPLIKFRAHIYIVNTSTTIHIHHCSANILTDTTIATIDETVVNASTNGMASPSLFNRNVPSATASTINILPTAFMCFFLTSCVSSSICLDHT